MKLAVVVLALSGGMAAQDLAPETILVARIKDHLRAQLAHLPDYTCLESIIRYHRQSEARAKLLPLDRLYLEVLYSGTQEYYGWPGSRTLDEKDPSRFIGAGMIGTGLFALFQKGLLNGAAAFEYRGEESGGAGGQPAVRYDYRVPRLRSGQKVVLAAGEGTVGLKGSFWADPRSLDLLRLTVEADEIPPYLPLDSMSARMDYAHTRIGSSDTLLVQNADLHMREIFGDENYDRFGFTHCSQYQAQSTLSFDPAAPVEHLDGDPGSTGLPAAPAAGPAPDGGAAAEPMVPALLLVTVELRTPIKTGDAIGTPLEGRTRGDVMHKGKLLIPSGSKVSGRLRRLEQSSLKPGYFVVGIEFSEIEVRGTPMPFYADLIRLDRREGILATLTSKIDRPLYPGVDRETEQSITLPEIPGVASFFIPGKTLALPSGFWTAWRTRGPLHE